MSISPFIDLFVPELEDYWTDRCGAMHTAAKTGRRRYEGETDLSKAADGDGAGKDRPRPGSDDHTDNTTSSHRTTVWIAHRHKTVNGDVHERVDRRDDKQWRHEPCSEAERRIKHPRRTNHRRQRERHCQQATEQVGDRQTTEKQVGTSAHATVTDDDDDDQRVSDHRDDHNGE